MLLFIDQTFIFDDTASINKCIHIRSITLHLLSFSIVLIILKIVNFPINARSINIVAGIFCYCQICNICVISCNKVKVN